MSPQSENVLFAQSRNVLLTLAGWGVGNGPTLDDAEGARPTGSANENQEEADHAKAGSGGNPCQRAASPAHAAELEGTGRQSGRSCGARQKVESEIPHRSRARGHRDPESRCVPRVRADFGSGVSGEEAQAGSEPRDVARLDDQKQAVARESQACREDTYLAHAAEPLGRIGADGHQRARMAGEPRSEAVSGQHDRRCDQPDAGALRGTRLDGREHGCLRAIWNGTEDR
jgi:hypothetical protein